MRTSRRRGWIYAIMASLAVMAIAAISTSVTADSDSRLADRHDHHTSLPRASAGNLTPERTSVIDGVTWTLDRAVSSAGICLGVTAHVNDVEQGRVEAGCSTSDTDKLQWGLGGLEVAGGWYNVAYGQAPSTTATVDLRLGDGAVLSDASVASTDGLWLFVFPAAPTTQASDVDEIIALDRSGAVVARESPPSIVEYRELAMANPKGA